MTTLGRSGSSAGIAVDATSVYWTALSAGPGTPGGAVLSCPLSGGATTTLTTGQYQPWSIAVDATNVYWTAWSNVVSVPKDGGVATTLGSGPTAAYGLAALPLPVAPGVTAQNIYWTVPSDPAGGPGVAGWVLAVPAAGGTTVTLASGTMTPSDIAIDDTSIYWADDTLTQIMKMPLDGGTPEALPGTFNPMGVTAVAVDATSVYWATVGDSASVMKLTPK